MDQKKTTTTFMQRFAFAAMVFGTLAGPGNASGTSTVHFFVQYGWYAAFMPIIAMAITCIGMYWMIEYSRPLGTKTYDAAFRSLYGKYGKYVTPLVDLSMLLTLLSGFCIVLVQCGNIASTVFGLNEWVGIIGIIIIGLISSVFGMKLFSRIQSTLTTIMLVIMVLVFGYGIINGFDTLVTNVSNLWVPENTSTFDIWFWGIGNGFCQLFLLSVALPGSNVMKTSADNKKSMILTYVMVTFLFWASSLAFLGFAPGILGDDSPSLYLANMLFGRAGQLVYTVSLLAAIITTIAGYCFTITTRYSRYIPKAITNEAVRGAIPNVILIGFCVFMSRLGLNSIFNYITAPNIWLTLITMGIPTLIIAPRIVIKRRKEAALAEENSK